MVLHHRGLHTSHNLPLQAGGPDWNSGYMEMNRRVGMGAYINLATQVCLCCIDFIFLNLSWKNCFSFGDQALTHGQKCSGIL